MGAYAKDAVDVAKRNFQIDLDFSEESIQQIEAIASRQFAVIVEGDGPSDRNLETFCKIWGAYIGEVFRRHHGGEWVVPQEGFVPGPLRHFVRQWRVQPTVESAQAAHEWR